MQKNNVKHPTHYTRYGVEGVEGVEVIEIIKVLPFCLGNVVKYVLRAPFKNGAEDCKKALQYLEWCANKSIDMNYSTSYEFNKNIDKYRDCLLIEDRANNPVAQQQAEFLSHLQNCIWCGFYETLRPFIEEMQKILEEQSMDNKSCPFGKFIADPNGGCKSQDEQVRNEYQSLLVLPDFAVPLCNIQAIRRTTDKDIYGKEEYLIVFSMSQQYGGQSFKTTDKAEWEAAWQKSLQALAAYHANKC